MQAIRDYFREAGREPTDIELETLAQTWSEHCVHKTLRSTVTYREKNASPDQSPGIAMLGLFCRACQIHQNSPRVFKVFCSNWTYKGEPDLKRQPQGNAYGCAHRGPAGMPPGSPAGLTAPAATKSVTRLIGGRR